MMDGDHVAQIFLNFPETVQYLRTRDLDLEAVLNQVEHVRLKKLLHHRVRAGDQNPLSHGKSPRFF